MAFDSFVPFGLVGIKDASDGLRSVTMKKPRSSVSDADHSHTLRQSNNILLDNHKSVSLQ